MGVSGGPVGLYQCHRMGGNQLITYTATNQIKHHYHCLDVDQETGAVVFKDCSGTSQEWLHNAKDKTLMLKRLGKCLTMVNLQKLTMEPCDGGVKEQKWLMESPMK